MGAIETMRGQVAAAEGLAGLLEAAWEALSLAESVCWVCEAWADELFAAFAFAGVAAAEARMALMSAPSLSTGPGGQASGAPVVPADAGAVADAVTSLARMLEERLAAAGREAGDPGDRKACEETVAGTGRIIRLLARGER